LNAQEIISSGILELYCMELTSAAETAAVNQWAKDHPEIAAEIEAIRSGLEGYALAHAVDPDPSVKEKLFAAINSNTAAPVIHIGSKEKESTTAKVYGMSSSWKYAAAAGMVLLAGSLVLNYTYYNKYQSANTELASAQTELQQQKEMADAMKKEFEVIGDRNSTPFVLTAMPDVANADARIYWVKNTGEVYIDPSNLPEPEKGKQYQFWAIVDGVPVSGGMIDTNIEIKDKKVRLQKMKSFGKAQAFAVSLEDAGPEKPAPTKVMVLGKI